MSRHDFDHAAAFEIFANLQPPNRTYAEVARRVGASETSVRRWAKVYEWERRIREAQERAMRRAEKTVEQRTAQLLRIFDAAADRVELSIDELPPELVFAKFPEIHRIYRLETDQATDQLALAEVQAGFRTAMEVAVRVVDDVAVELLGNEMRSSFVRVFRSRFLPAVNEALAIGEGNQGP